MRSTVSRKSWKRGIIFRELGFIPRIRSRVQLKWRSLRLALGRAAGMWMSKFGSMRPSILQRSEPRTLKICWNENADSRGFKLNIGIGRIVDEGFSSSDFARVSVSMGIHKCIHFHNFNFQDDSCMHQKLKHVLQFETPSVTNLIHSFLTLVWEFESPKIDSTFIYVNILWNSNLISKLSCAHFFSTHLVFKFGAASSALANL